ncbi:transporter substrate-binding domain-containing protein [Sorangium sp. So ce134]
MTDSKCDTFVTVGGGKLHAFAVPAEEAIGSLVALATGTIEAMRAGAPPGAGQRSAWVAGQARAMEVGTVKSKIILGVAVLLVATVILFSWPRRGPSPVSITHDSEERTGTTGASERPVITIASTDWLPFHGESLEGGGCFSVALRTALERVGYRVDIKFYPWKRAVTLAENGDVEVLGSDYYGKKREEHFIYSDPLWETYSGFVKQKNREFPYSVHPEDMDKTYRPLTPFRIGVVAEYTYEQGFEDASYLQKTSVPNEASLLKMLIEDRLDLVMIDRYTSEYYMKNDPQLIPHMSQVEFMQPPVSRNWNYYLISRKGKRPWEIAKAMNQGIQLIRADGTLDAIMADQRYMKARN